MIRDTLSRHKNPAITSDRWHVVHARWSGNASSEPLFQRSIVSEHDDRSSAVSAARQIRSSLTSEMASRTASTRDQVFVRPPSFKSLKIANRQERRRK